VDARRDPCVHVEPVVADERVEVAARVRDQTDLEAAPTKLGKDGERILVELEVLGLQPAIGDGDRDLATALPLAAHAADDVLREADPDLFVVVELGMVLKIEKRGRAGVRIAGGIELQSEAPSRVAVALRTEERPWLHDREVDVEENRFEL
jgi:hypothetical protein